ncbi:hypothetical protein KR222_011374 [Zaprionus bogoriensis]|nr:hypothetical protein KR222_011374 [Zaprionus bogoriensis]
MDATKQLSIVDIRNYMLQNDGRVTNHALVKHFKKYLTNTPNEAESRKRFKIYVTLLSTIKNENNQKYLILRKKYANECPSEEVVERAVEAAGNASTPSSPGGGSIVSVADSVSSPLRQPPPYKAPPEVQPSPPPAPVASGSSVHPQQVESYRECVNEFTVAMQSLDPARLELQSSKEAREKEREHEAKAEQQKSSAKSVSRANSVDETGNKENIPRFSFSSGASTDSSATDKLSGPEADAAENPISVKEATRKFNRMASEEEAKIISPPAKKKPEKQLIEEKDSPEVTLSHPKAKEWIVSMAKANYQELAKLASDHPELVKLQVRYTILTALHWAAKHGNEDVVKLIAGTYKADVNARTGYTPLHLATQFGRDNIFELLWNVYKANRDIMDWSGMKPLDYSRQRPSVSASTCSSEYLKYFPNAELNNNYYLGAAYPDSLPYASAANDISGGGVVGGTLGSALTRGKKRSQLLYATVAGGGATRGGTVTRTQSLMASTRRYKKPSVQSLLFSEANEIDEDQSVALAKLKKDINLSSNAEQGAEEQTRSGAPARRKESFLRKTFRSAAGARRPTKDAVTNNNNNNNPPTHITCKANRLPLAVEKDLGFLRIGSLNVRVKKTTEAFSNFLGVGGNGAMTCGPGGPIEVGRHQQQRSHRHPHQRHHLHANGTTRDRHHPTQRASATAPYGMTSSRSSVPINRNLYDAVHKSWGSADNITQRSENLMPPPKSVDFISKRNKSSKRSSYASNATDSPRDSICSSNSSSNLNSGYSSMPTTPNQIRAPKSISSSITGDSDSDSACGFGSNWSVNDRSSKNNILKS